MKKLLLILVCAFGTQMAMAQRPQPNLPFEIVVNRTTMNYPRKQVEITVWIDKNAPMGIAARFKSNVPISSLETDGTGGTAPVKNVLNLNDNTFDGLIYLNAPSYNQSQTYILSFYMAGLPKAVWKTAIQRKN